MSASTGGAEELAELQRWLQQVMTHPNGVGEGVRAAGDCAAVKLTGAEDLARVVLPSARMQPLQRLGVYHDAYFSRLLSCLGDDYPALRALLGADRFAELCKRYVAAHPPRAASLNDYGSELPAFCGAEPRADAGLLRDLARVEWASVELIHAPEQPALSPADVAARADTFATARLVPVAALRLLELEHPVHALYEALRAGQRGQPPQPGRSFELLRRSDWQVRCEDLLPAEGELLGRVLAGMPLGDALAVADERGVSERDVSAWFQRWLGEGMFAAFV